MSDLKHTPELWYLVDGNKIYRRPESELYEYNGRCGGVAGDKAIAIADKGWYGIDEAHFPHLANAARIVACVNACAGKPNPERWIKEAEATLQKVYDFEHPDMKLGESKVETLLKFAKERDELKAQRDEMHALLNDVYNVINEPLWRQMPVMEKLGAYIAKAKGGQP